MVWSGRGGGRHSGRDGEQGAEQRSRGQRATQFGGSGGDAEETAVAPSISLRGEACHIELCGSLIG